MVHVEVELMEVKDIERVREMSRNWASETNPTIRPCPSEARYLTGYQDKDAMIHYFSLASGLDPIFSLDTQSIVGYNIVDEKKFAWFMLRWG
jgi:glutamyl-tRNA reductase